MSEGALVTGTVSAPTAGECARCLTPITGHVEIDLTELFAYPDSATDETTDADELGRVIDDTIDLEQPIIDAIGLALPFSPLCGPDCAGLCPRVRRAVGDRRARPPSRADRSAVGQAGGHAWTGTTSDVDRAACSRRWVSTCPRTAHHRADAPQLLLRERRAAHQRAPGVPRRRRARADHHRGALPPPPRPLRGRPGQAARQHRQHPGAGRCRPRI